MPPVLTLASFPSACTIGPGKAESNWGDVMSKSLFALSSAMLFACAPCVAQVAPAPATTPVLQAGIAADNTLRTGTEIQLKLAEPLSTKKKVLRVGYHFQMEVAEAVTVNNQVVIPVGSPATGEITEVRNKGMWGKSGHLTASILYVRVNGRQIRLSGTFDDKGVTGTAGVVAAIALVPVAGFFTTGTSANIPSGSQVKGFIAEDVPLVFAQTAPTPMTVQAASAPLPTSAPTVVPAVAVKTPK